MKIDLPQKPLWRNSGCSHTHEADINMNWIKTKNIKGRKKD